MSTTTKYISLDFYNNSVVNIYAKQSDENARFINVTCTDHGKKVSIDKTKMSAFIRMKKADETYIYNDTEILDNGTILITLTQQMLAVSGKQIADVMILSTPDITSDELTSLDSINDLNNVSVVSVMNFYIVVSSSAVDNSVISSSNEFDALVQATARMKALEKTVRTAETSRIEAENEREENEDTRIANERSRVSAENTRKSNETKRQSNEETREANESERKAAETERNLNEKTRQNNETNRANTMTQKINEWNTSVNNTISSCETATAAANTAVAEFETIKDQSGIIMQDEKGVANGVATLDGNGKVPSGQLNISSFIKNNLTTTTTGYVLDASQGNEIRLTLEELQGLINSVQTSLQETINGLQKIHFNSTVDNSIGKNGDVLMVPIS